MKECLVGSKRSSPSKTKSLDLNHRITKLMMSSPFSMGFKSSLAQLSTSLRLEISLRFHSHLKTWTLHLLSVPVNPIHPKSTTKNHQRTNSKTSCLWLTEKVLRKWYNKERMSAFCLTSTEYTEKQLCKVEKTC